MILTFNNKILTAGTKWLEQGSSPTPSFRTVVIGNQEWMAENLAIDDGGEGIVHFDNVTANGVNFGTQYYYTQVAALRIAESIEGWHLPSKSEFEELAATAGGMLTYGTATKLKSTSGWTGTQGSDIFGFTALPVGNYRTELSGVGSYASFMSSTTPVKQPWTMGMDGETYLRQGTTYADTHTSIRLVKD